MGFNDLVVTEWVKEVLSDFRGREVSPDDLKELTRTFNALTPKEKETAFLFLLGERVRDGG